MLVVNIKRNEAYIKQQERHMKQQARHMKFPSLLLGLGMITDNFNHLIVRFT